MKSYLIDCDTCESKPTSCSDCLMATIASPEFGQPVRFSEQEREALSVMAEVGLVPPLRLVAA